MLLAIKIDNIHAAHTNHMAILDCIQFLSFISNYLIHEHGRDNVGIRVRVMVFNTTFNNISVKSWRSVLLVEETVVPRYNHV
jgi:hypothetical protein